MGYQLKTFEYKWKAGMKMPAYCYRSQTMICGRILMLTLVGITAFTNFSAALDLKILAEAAF